jgi:hypothetical protein
MATRYRPETNLLPALKPAALENHGAIARRPLGSSRPGASRPSPGASGTCGLSMGPLPDLFFPVDRSWLVSALWDDAWTCVGGTDDLIDRLPLDPRVQARRVRLGEDATPPGREFLWAARYDPAQRRWSRRSP